MRHVSLINDISDHLPVFSIYDYNYRNKKTDKQIEFRRIRREELIHIDDTFKIKLLAQNWEILYQENNVDDAYPHF